MRINTHLTRQKRCNDFSTDSCLVQGALVACCVGVVLRQGGGEIVRSAEILLGREVEVVVLGVVQHGVDGLGADKADGAGRQSGILICIIR